MTTVTINGKSYETAALSDVARQQIANIQFVDAEITRLQQQLAVLQTARNAYAAALVDNVQQAAAPAPAAAEPKKPARSRSKKA